MWPQNTGSKNSFRSTHESTEERLCSLAVILQRWCKYVCQMGDTRCICTQNSSVGMTVLIEMWSVESLLAYFSIWSNRRKQITCSWDKAIWNINKWRIESPLFWNKAPQPRRGDCICIATSLITHKWKNLKIIQLTRSEGGKSATQA
jgi:hypothetical protein